MDIRRYIAAAAAAAIASLPLSGCGKKKTTGGSEPPVQIAETTSATADPSSVQPPTEVYPEYPVT